MMARRGVLGLLGAWAASALAGCGVRRTSGEVRYEVALEVRVNGAIRSGSSVWSWRLTTPDVPLASPYNGKFRGEAVVVELDGDRILFAILRGADGENAMAEMLPERFFGDIGRSVRGEQTRFGSDRIADIRDIASRIGETVTLDCAAKPGWCPMLVTFRDRSDPTSIERVIPANIASALGEGSELTGVKVTITDRPVTTGIGKRLPWLADVNRIIRGSGFRPKGIPVGDFKGLFSRGMS